MLPESAHVCTKYDGPYLSSPYSEVWNPRAIPRTQFVLPQSHVLAQSAESRLHLHRTVTGITVPHFAHGRNATDVPFTVRPGFGTITSITGVTSVREFSVHFLS